MAGGKDGPVHFDRLSNQPPSGGCTAPGRGLKPQKIQPGVNPEQCWIRIIIQLSSRASGLRGIGQSPSERAERVDQRTLHTYFGATWVSMSAVGLSWKQAASEGDSGGDEDGGS
jgi:hypothetical protein